MHSVMKRRTQSGYGLLEAMISVLVVSIGFLGLAGVQVKGLASSNSSLLRSQAVYLSYQMADRLRANLPAAQAGAYNSLSGSPSDPGCVTSGCTPALMAQNDYYEWSGEIVTLLPDGSGVVCIDSTPDDGDPGAPQCDNVGNVFSIKIWWTEKTDVSRFVTTFRP
jgi:type IV pilus assembly protein PilV